MASFNSFQRKRIFEEIIHDDIVQDVIDLSNEEDDAPMTGKGKQPKNKMSECCICGTRTRVGIKCFNGHTTCKKCTKMYVSKTLVPRGVVYYDKIPCTEGGCNEFLKWTSCVETCLDKKTKDAIEKKAMDVAHLLVGERDPSSQKLMTKNCHECPNCHIPIFKDGGCNHMTCKMCRHEYFSSCKCKFPFHQENCGKDSYPMARHN